MAAKAQSPAENDAPAGTVGKDLVNKDGRVTELIEWATQSASSPEDILDKFAEAGIPVSSGSELTGDYVVVHGEEKARWCSAHVGQRLMVVQWHFYEGKGDSEFAAMHIVSNAGKFIVNDGATGGMYGQLRRITDIREQNDEKAAANRTSTAGLMVAGGLRQNKPFMYSISQKCAIPKRELDDVEKWPMSDREESRPTWSFDL